MNEWQCDYAGCRNKVVGLGGAIGLRAIGWYFAPGPSLRCPLHRPDPAPCTDEATEAEQRPEACPMCSGDRDAQRWQSEMNRAYGLDGPTAPDGTEAPEKPWSHTMTDTQFAALHIRNRLVAYLGASSAWSKRGPLDRCVHWAHVGCRTLPGPDYISVPFADHPDLAWLLGQALTDLVTHVGSEALSEVLGQSAAGVTNKLYGKPFHAPRPAAEPGAATVPLPQCTSLPRDQSAARATSAPVTRAEFDALAGRVARLEAPPEPDIDSTLEFNLRCAAFGKRVRAGLGTEKLHPTPREASSMARALLLTLGKERRSHYLREPTLDDCIVVVTGSGWPAEIIPAVARWLGFKDERGLEEALADDVRRAVRNGAGS